MSVAGPVRAHQRTTGAPHPLGATVLRGGVNFSLYSRSATAVELLLFERAEDPSPGIIPIDPVENRTYHYWHIFVPAVQPGQIYAFRVDDGAVLLDPYGRGVIIPENYNRYNPSIATAMKSVVPDHQRYDWEGDQPLRRPSSRTIVYEMHVRGFTRHPSSGIDDQLRGTYAGLIQKIPYLKDLGITAVELLPIFAFDPQDAPLGRVNYWGYAPVSFFAPHPAFSSRSDPAGAVHEFRDMVKALHRAGIEVILDVVYNHTAEGDRRGPTFCFRGIDNSTYYILKPDGSYANFSGTGNTLNANHPIVRRMILDSLRYWVREMHVDGFRFDLASILARDADGDVLANPPVLWDIETDPVLAGTKIIAEAWDAAGLYQVGSFVGDSWKEWNGKFRDDVRAFFRAEENSVTRLADRLLGSPEIYGREEREPEQSVNFVTCHDGFTLNDLVSYNDKHNEPNGEANNDGADDNRSWNCGVEGPSTDPAIEALRNCQMKNFFTVTLLSLGVPMIVMGDEMRRTQNGNNNAYCQDNETSWLDWNLLSQHADLHRFVRLLVARRLLRDQEHERSRMSLNQLLREARHTWHGTKPNLPDWSPWSHSLALEAELKWESMWLYTMFNAYWEPLDFELPRGHHWLRWIDTALPSPEDIVDWQSAVPVQSLTYRAGPRSVVVLVSNVVTLQEGKDQL